MPGKYLNVKEAAQTLGVSEDEIKQLLERRELHGYRDGADWKFKPEDVEKIAKDRRGVRGRRRRLARANGTGTGRRGDVGHGHRHGFSDKAATESDVRLADSDIQPAAAGRSRPRRPPQRKRTRLTRRSPTSRNST